MIYQHKIIRKLVKTQLVGCIHGTFAGDWLKYNPCRCCFSNMNPVGGLSLPFPYIRDFESGEKISAEPSCKNGTRLKARKYEIKL